EVIIETTANGFNDLFKLWRKAEAGESELMPIFLPWSVAPEYRARVPEDFEPTGDEKRLMGAAQARSRTNSLAAEQDFSLAVRSTSNKNPRCPPARHSSARTLIPSSPPT